MVKCKICSGVFENSPDSVILCSHHDGSVHFGCCVDNCSANKQPCEHSQGLYDKITANQG